MLINILMITGLRSYSEEKIAMHTAVSHCIHSECDHVYQTKPNILVDFADLIRVESH